MLFDRHWSLTVVVLDDAHVGVVQLVPQQHLGVPPVAVERADASRADDVRAIVARLQLGRRLRKVVLGHTATGFYIVLGIFRAAFGVAAAPVG